MKAFKTCARMSGLIALGALVLALASHAAGGATGEPAGAKAAQKNLVDLHANAGMLGNRECLACHAGIPKEVSLKGACAKDASAGPKCTRFHRVHLESKLDTPKKCADCHQSIDLRNGSAAALRRQIDPQLCAGCHGGGMKGAKVLYAR